jgi:hypothetical protein
MNDNQHIEPPGDDGETNRHRFYAQMAASNNNIAGALGRIFNVLKGIETKLDDFEKLKTEMNTTKKFAAGVYSLMLIVVGWIFVQSLGALNRIDKLERTAEVWQIIFKPHEQLPDQMQSMRNRVNTLEDKLSDMEKGKK